MRPASSQAIVAVLIVFAVLNLFANTLTFGGDPEIHLVFGKNLLEGFPLQFNQGIYSSGETSPAYMILVGCLLAALGTGGAAIAMKLIGVFSGLGLLWILYHETKALAGPDFPAGMIAVSVAAAPAFFFQAQLGMENMPFALGVALLIRSLLNASQTARRFVLTAVLAHLSFFWRPEAVFVVVVCYLWAAGAFAASRSVWRFVLLLALSAALVIGVALIEKKSGVPLQGAGRMRALMSQFESSRLPLLPVSVSKKPLIFLLYSWPLLLAVVLGRQALSRRLTGVLLGVVVLPWILHFFVLFPNGHFSRYILYIWFPIAFISVHCLRNIQLALRNRLVYLFAANTLLVALAEVPLRIWNGSYANQALVSTWLDRTPEAIRAISDELCGQVSCSETPVVVAAQEVQIRLRLDERFVVRSLDGIVDSDLDKYVRNGAVDHLQYLTDRKVAVVIDFPTYGRTSSESLGSIFEQSAEGPVRVGCARFERGAFRSRHILLRRVAPCRQSNASHLDSLAPL